MENGVVVEQGNTFDVFSTPKHPTTKALVERYLGIAVPPQLVPSLPAGTIVELRYKGMRHSNRSSAGSRRITA